MKEQKKNLHLVYAVAFVDLFAIGLIYPLLANHLRALGASHFTVGLLSSLYSGLQVISGPIIGSWSDVKDRKSVLIVTLLIGSASYVVLGITNSIFIIAAMRLVLGITKHTQSLCKAVITDLVPANERAGAFGQAAAFSSIGFIVGPLIGGHLSEISNGFSYTCTLTGLLFIINIGLILLVKEPRKEYENLNRSNLSMWTNFWKELHESVTELTEIDWRILWDTFLLRFIFGCSITIYFAQQSIHLREQFNLSQKHIGYTISFYSVVSTLSAFFIRSINNFCYKNDVNCFKRLTHFFALMTTSSFCLYLAPNIQVHLLILIPFALSSTVLRVVTIELMLKEGVKAHRGSLSGASNSIMSISRFITPATSGLVSDTFGVHKAMLFAVMPPLIGIILALIMKTKHSVKEKHK